MTTVLMVIFYILNCIWVRTKPCKYFQLNSAYFNVHKGIFSKLDLDRLIPKKWRLKQTYLDKETIVEKFPVFVKPEWGQNANGVIKVENQISLDQLRTKPQPKQVRNLVQQSTKVSREYEIFLMQVLDQTSDYILTVTEVINKVESKPINSIYNPDTFYREITDTFPRDGLLALRRHIQEMGDFRICRVSVSAVSKEALIDGKFQVIEINLFTPLPINLLDRRYTFFDRLNLVRQYMRCLARITKYRNKSLKEKPVFIKCMLYHRRNGLLNFIRARR